MGWGKETQWIFCQERKLQDACNVWEIEINNWVHYILIIMVDLSMYQVADAKGAGNHVYPLEFE